MTKKIACRSREGEFVAAIVIAFVTVVEGDEDRFALGPGRYEVGELDSAVAAR